MYPSIHLSEAETRVLEEYRVRPDQSYVAVELIGTPEIPSSGVLARTCTSLYWKGFLDRTNEYSNFPEHKTGRICSLTKFRLCANPKARGPQL